MRQGDARECTIGEWGRAYLPSSEKVDSNLASTNPLTTAAVVVIVDVQGEQGVLLELLEVSLPN